MPREKYRRASPCRAGPSRAIPSSPEACPAVSRPASTIRVRSPSSSRWRSPTPRNLDPLSRDAPTYPPRVRKRPRHPPAASVGTPGARPCLTKTQKRRLRRKREDARRKLQLDGALASVARTAARKAAAEADRAVAAVRPRMAPGVLPDRVGPRTGSRCTSDCLPDGFSVISSLSDSDRE